MPEQSPEQSPGQGAEQPVEQSADQDSAGEPELSYEQARDQLVETVRRLEAGGTTLEESLALWQRGEELAGVCQRWLDGARAKLERAVKDDGHA